MTLTQTSIPYRRMPVYDAQIAALDWERVFPPDHMQQEEPLLNLVSAIRDIVTERGARRDVFVSTGTFLCYDPDDLNRRLAPDLYIAFGVDKDAIRSRSAGYLPWEVGKAPDFVLEVASPSTARNDLTRKRDLYARIGIAEYWRFDATGGDFYGEPLVGEQLVHGEYQRLELTDEPDGNLKGHSPALDITLAWRDGDLRVYEPETGEYTRTYVEDWWHIDQQADIIDEQADVIDDLRESNAEKDGTIAELRRRLEAALGRRNGGGNGQSN